MEQSGKLAGLTGKTTVIMFSDGMANVGADPVMEAKQILEKYPNVVVHVVSLAQPGVKDMSIAGKGMNQAEEQKGADINRQIAQLGKGMLVDAAELYRNPAAIQRFVMDVFCLEEKVVNRGSSSRKSSSEASSSISTNLISSLNFSPSWMKRCPR